MSEVRKRKGTDRLGSAGRIDTKYANDKHKRSSRSTFTLYAGCLALLWLISPYQIEIVNSSPPLMTFIRSLGLLDSYSGSDAIQKMKLVQTEATVPAFVPIDFSPENGSQQKSFDLYKKARTVDPGDVVVNSEKVSWFNFDVNGYIDKGRIKANADAYKAGGFNQLVSDDIPMDRDVPESRLGGCPHQIYSDDLPTTSIIITFHNELRSTLLRTIISVLRRTPAKILKEIVLVDDASADSSIGTALTQIEKVKLVVNRQREGLIRARIRAAMVAEGDTLTFLDSHVEVNEMWIEPLMAKIKANEKMVVAPIIDVINKDTFDYIGADAHLTGGVTWAMVFRWDWLTNIEYRTMDHTVGLKTPTIAGGLFSIAKKWFHELGEYDDQMDIWGGENIEFSFRVWQCGGEMEILPCSRVGHVFRDDHPYDFGSKGANNVFIKNNNRFVHTWMDDYKDFYYGTRPNARTVPPGDLSIRLHIRNTLQCKSFEWYMNNVYSRQHMPERDSTTWGHAKRGQYCLQSFEKKSSGVKYLGGGNCNQGLYNPNWQEMDLQSFVLKTETNYFQQPVKRSNGSYKNLCWGAETKVPKAGQLITLTPCQEDDDSHQKWNYHGTSLKLMDYPDLCMDAKKIGQFKLAKCSTSENQQILFEMLHI